MNLQTDYRELERRKFYLEGNDNIVFMRTGNEKDRYTSFGEYVTAKRTSRINFKPTWGVSQIRDSVTTTGTGAVVTETGGEYELDTGTATDNVARIQTLARGQYQAGTMGEVGIGVRIPNNPTGSQSAKWGYFDSNYGFGWGVDANGLFVFRRNNGTDTITYQDSFNEDLLDGSGRSGLSVDLTAGNIFQIDFTWYGYGSINFYLNVKNPRDGDKRVLAHTINVPEQVSVTDPNQPLTAEALNGSSSDTSFKVYLGGRQFSYVDGDSEPNLRRTPIEVTSQTITSTSYTPVMSLRKKTTFNGRDNSVNAFLNGLQITTDNPVYIMVDYGGSSSGGSWVTPVDVNSDETAIEVNTTITGATPYTALDKVVVGSEKNRQITSVRQERLPLGQDTEIVIYARKTSATDAIIGMILDVEEEW